MPTQLPLQITAMSLLPYYADTGVIKDFNQKVLEVQGDGVIGEQPRLEPGEQFTYTSGTSIETDVGTMKGSYTMQTDGGEEFDATIPEFVLSAPQTTVH